MTATCRAGKAAWSALPANTSPTASIGIATRWWGATSGNASTSGGTADSVAARVDQQTIGSRPNQCRSVTFEEADDRLAAGWHVDLLEPGPIRSAQRKHYPRLEWERLLALVMVPTDEPLVCSARRDRRPSGFDFSLFISCVFDLLSVCFG